jgi:hypothetical protein
MRNIEEATTRYTDTHKKKVQIHQVQFQRYPTVDIIVIRAVEV